MVFGVWHLRGGVFAQGRGSHALPTQGVGGGGLIQPPAKCVALRCPRPSARANNALVTTTRGGVSAPFGTLFWRSLKIKFSCNLGPGMAFWRCGVLPRHLLPHVGLSRRVGHQTWPGTGVVPLPVSSEGARQQRPCPSNRRRRCRHFQWALQAPLFFGVQMAAGSVWSHSRRVVCHCCADCEGPVFTFSGSTNLPLWTPVRRLCAPPPRGPPAPVSPTKVAEAVWGGGGHNSQRQGPGPYLQFNALV